MRQTRGERKPAEREVGRVWGCGDVTAPTPEKLRSGVGSPDGGEERFPAREAAMCASFFASLGSGIGEVGQGLEPGVCGGVSAADEPACEHAVSLRRCRSLGLPRTGGR